MKTINGAELKKMLIGGGQLLEVNKAMVDALNVFPVPDGDTGTNMYCTISTAVKELVNIESTDIDDVVNAFARGALRGARGNSGVILSQIIKGLSKVFSENKTITSKIFASAIQSATQVAYNAVTKPKEGTILTVIRYMGENAMTIANRNSNIITFLDAVIRKGEEILAKTPDMLPVLKKAGVVDAGGKGLILVFQGFYNILAGVEMPTVPETTESSEIAEVDFAGDLHDFDEIKFGYCTEFFIVNLLPHITEEDIEKLRDKLMAIGDSVIAIGDLNLVKVHVHTNNPNKALGYAMKMGELDKIKIDNMLQQGRELLAKKEANKKPIGMIAICTGSGIADIFKDMQVDIVIEGGQTMNPSVQDILRAIETVNSDNVIVLPNNKNIILAAEQAQQITNKKCAVIPTVNIPQGIAGAIVFDPSLSLDENAENMAEAFAEIAYGEVTYAVRTATIDGFALKEGDIIGLGNKKIISRSDNVESCAMEVIENLTDDDKSVISIYYGDGMTESEAQEFCGKVEEKYPDYDVTVYYGGQHHYYYLISIE